jgi:hypothetical protein
VTGFLPPSRSRRLDADRDLAFRSSNVPAAGGAEPSGRTIAFPASLPVAGPSSSQKRPATDSQPPSAQDAPPARRFSIEAYAGSAAGDANPAVSRTNVAARSHGFGPTYFQPLDERPDASRSVI